MSLKIIKIKTSENWYIRGAVRGTSVFKSTGTKNKVIAEEERRDLEDSLSRKRSILFGKAAEKYLDGGGSEKFLLDQFDKDTDNWTGVLGQFEKTPISDITQDELDAAAKRAFPNVKPQTLNRQFYTPFIAVYNFTARSELCEKREWRRPRVRRSDIEKTKWFSCLDAAKMLDALPPHLRVILIFCIYTGARITEAVEMEIKDVHLQDRWAVINATKTDSYRGVPLHKAAVWALRQYIGDRKDGRVFLTQKDLPYKTKRNAAGFTEGGGYFKTAWATGLTNASLKGYTPYSMRHSLNNWLILEGIDQTMREAIMGHDNQSTNSIYSDVPQKRLIEAIDKLPDFTDFSHLKRMNHAMFTKNSVQICWITTAK